MVNAMHVSSSVTMYNILHFAEITVGYVDTSVTVFESAGVAQLTVAISVPPQADPIETSFSLLVNTNDGTATAGGLSPCLEIDLHIHTHFSASESLDQISRFTIFVFSQIKANPQKFCPLLNLVLYGGYVYA